MGHTHTHTFENRVKTDEFAAVVKCFLTILCRHDFHRGGRWNCCRV